MIYGIIFDVEFIHPQRFSQSMSAHERCNSRIEPRLRLTNDRQQLAIPPKIPGTTRNSLTGHRSTGHLIVVTALERSQTLIAYIQRFGRKPGLAHRTPQTGNRSHGRSSPLFKIGSHSGGCT